MALRRLLDATRRLRVQFALIIAVAMAPAGLVAVVQASSNIEDAIRLEEERLRKAARRVTEDERAAVVAIRERMRLAARSPAIKQLGGAQCDEALARLVEADSRFSGALVLNNQGTVVCGDRKGFDLSDTAVFQSFTEVPRQLVGPVRLGRISGKNMMLALSPILADDGRTGVLAMGIAADFFQRLVASSEGAVRFGLIDSAGKMFAQNRSEHRDWLPDDVERLLQEEEVVEHAEARDGMGRIYYVAPMPIESIWLIAARPELTWGEVLLSRNGLSFLAPLLLWAIAVTVAFFVIDRLVSRHVLYLQRVAAAIGRGHLDIGKLRLEGAPSEIRRLGEALEVMSSRLAQREAALRANVESKKALLLEVHHRVKNNLQMISSLMNMQLRRIRGEDERRSIHILQDRIHGLALVHQNLYATEKLDAVSIDKLVRDLAEHLRSSLSPAGAQIELTFELQPIEAGAETATPIALFLVEAVANSFKHAYRANAEGKLDITLRPVGDEEFELTVVNTVEDAEGTQGEGTGQAGLGERLMEGFARQIAGTVRREITGDRFTVVLRAPLSPRSKGFTLRRKQKSEDAADRAEAPQEQRSA